MKRWYLVENGIEYMCSLLALAGKAKVMSVRDDNGHIIHFQFMKFFDFSRAKSGITQTGWCRLPHSDVKVRTKIIFK